MQHVEWSIPLSYMRQILWNLDSSCSSHSLLHIALLAVLTSSEVVEKQAQGFTCNVPRNYLYADIRVRSYIFMTTRECVCMVSSKNAMGGLSLLLVLCIGLHATAANSSFTQELGQGRLTDQQTGSYVQYFSELCIHTLANSVCYASLLALCDRRDWRMPVLLHRAAP